MSATEELKQVVQEREHANQRIQQVAREAFIEGVVELKRRFPELEQFSWTQYTPYFNDGDECYFGVNCDPDWSLKVNDQNDEDRVDDASIPYPSGATWNSPEHEAYQRKVEEALAPSRPMVQGVESYIESFEEDILKALFGDHVEVDVSISDQGHVTIDTEPYDHD